MRNREEPVRGLISTEDKSEVSCKLCQHRGLLHPSQERHEMTWAFEGLQIGRLLEQGYEY